MPSSEERKLFFLVGIALLITVGVRFIPEVGNFTNDDEFFNFISAVKLNIDHPAYDARLYNFEQPFLGKKLMGSLISHEKNYDNVKGITSNLYYYSYLGMPDIRSEEVSMRLIVALFGVLALFPLFAIGKFLFDTKTGIIAAAVGAISAGMINLSRVATQDGILPFFFLSTLYLGLEYFHAGDEKKWGVKKSTLYGIGMGLFLLLSTLVRVGQPIILAVALLAIALRNRKKLLECIALILAAGLAAYIGYSPRAISFFLGLEPTSTQFSGLHFEFISTFVGQNSYVFLGALALSIILLIRHKIWDAFSFSHAREKTNEWWGGISPRVQSALILTGVFFLALLLTDAGKQPRYAMVLFILPMILVIGFAWKKIHTHPKLFLAIGLLFLIDAGLVYANHVELTEYRVAGINPIYLAHDADRDKVLNFLESHEVPFYYTNDAWLMLRDPRAIPLPPRGQFFRESKNCDLDYFEQMEQSIVVYRNSTSDTVKDDRYLCIYMSGFSYLEFEQDGKYFIYGLDTFDANAVTE